MPIIIENLTHTYMPGSVTQFTALYDINLTVEDGEFFGIIGHDRQRQINAYSAAERSDSAHKRKSYC